MAPPEGRKISPYSTHCTESCDLLRGKKKKNTEKLEDRFQTDMAVKLGEEKKRPG